MMPKTIHTMARAYQHICAGEDPWTALGNFTNAWYDYAKGIRAALVSEPLGKPEADREHTRHWGAFCAASVEFLCDRYGVPCPEWVQEPSYTLSTPWYGDNIVNLADPVVLQHRMKTSPAPFAQRNVFCGNRLYQKSMNCTSGSRKRTAKAWALRATSGAMPGRKKRLFMEHELPRLAAPPCLTGNRFTKSCDEPACGSFGSTCGRKASLFQPFRP